MTNAQKNILITGCSSGIGAALVLEFTRRGHTVIATGRRLDSLAALRDLGVRTMELDVTSADSVRKLAQVLDAEGLALDMLINNAGYGMFGATTDQTVQDMRALFDTNVFAPVVLTNALLPLLRRRAESCVANIGSISGIVTTPFAGVYAASKAALHSISDAMRMELAPFGVRVITVQPGGIASNFGNAGEHHIHLPPASPFQPLAKAIQRRAQLSQKGATPAGEFAQVVVKHLLDPAAGAICRTGAQSTRLPLLKRLLPTRRLDAKMRQLFGLDALKAR